MYGVIVEIRSLQMLIIRQMEIHEISFLIVVVVSYVN